MGDGKENELQPSLNTANADKAYLCGRLLETLEEIQNSAIPGLDKTLADRYYARASTAPAFAFGILMQRTMPHLAKLEHDKPGAHIRLSKQMQEIMDLFEEPSFPQTFSIEEQARFAIGYWQQKSASIHSAIAAKATKEANGGQISEGDEDILQMHLLVVPTTTAEEEEN